MITELRAGYVLSSVRDLINTFQSLLDWNQVLDFLSAFVVETTEINPINNDPVFCVVDNMISRGLPTLTSLFIEDTLSQDFNFATKTENDKTGDIQYKIKEDISFDQRELIKSSFFIVDPSLDRHQIAEYIKKVENSVVDENVKTLLYTHILPDLFGECICQMLHPHTTMASIIQMASVKGSIFLSKIQDLIQPFFRQQIDFTIQFPYAEGHSSGLPIEIDDIQQYTSKEHQVINAKKEELWDFLGWQKSVRLNKDELPEIPESDVDSLLEFFRHPYYQFILENYSDFIWEKNYGKEALQLALTPFAIARIQKVITQLILAGELDLAREQWNFVIVERDVPCAALAIEDYRQLVNHLLAMENKDRTCPVINLVTIPSKEFEESPLLKKYISNDFSKADLLLDISMLQHYGFTEPDNKLLKKYKPSQTVVIRSAHFPTRWKKVSPSEPIRYNISSNKNQPHLVYFLQNLFRKRTFKPGQIDVLRRILSWNSALVFLPTNAGKSLAFQLATLLQPGMSLVIDPINSLMKDQNDHLKSVGIDSAVFINSAVEPTERKFFSHSMEKGFYQFVYIAPEHLQTNEFRQHVMRMKDGNFLYCIVDEAHCISEWSHDFRMAYMNLGNNLNRFVIKNDKSEKRKLPVIALTSTASKEVLADIKREFALIEPEAMIKSSNFERSEIQFRVIKTKDIKLAEISNYNQILKQLAQIKLEHVVDILNEIPNNFDSKDLFEFYRNDIIDPNCGIIFCPQKDGLLGVNDVSIQLKQKIRELSDKVGLFPGSLDNYGDYDLFEKIQGKFKRNEFTHLLTTKTFGIGIDKSNIRYIIHLNMPSSLESYYQQVGRAARDGDRALCYILYSDVFTSSGDRINIDKDFALRDYKNSFRGKEKERAVSFDLLDKITFPGLSQIDNLNNQITEKFNIKVKILLWSKGEQKRLYITGEPFPQSYGYIDLTRLHVVPEQDENRRIVDPEHAQVLLSEILEFINSNKKENKPLWQWMSGQFYSKPRIGIEKSLENMKMGESKTLTIGFENESAGKLAEILGQKWDSDMVIEANQYCDSSENFIENLKFEYWKSTQKWIDFYDETKEELHKYYFNLRDRSDTLRAIYRYTQLGVIDDFEIDFNAKVVHVKYTKKEDQEYINNLQHILGQSLSDNQLAALPDEISAYGKDSVIQGCLLKLLDFVYERIAPKRRSAVELMESAILEGVVDNDRFAQRINTCFESRILEDIHRFSDASSIKDIYTFLDQLQGETESLRELEKICDELLQENPDNASLLLFKSYSQFIGPDNNSSQAIDNFKSAFELFKNVNKWSRAEYVKHTNIFYSYCERFNRQAAIHLNEFILLDHLSWIRRFNLQFLKGVSNV